MPVRRATYSDIEAILVLADQKRAQYEAYEPTFWRRAPEAVVAQRSHFSALLQRDDVMIHVAEEAQSVVGFVVAVITQAPPVYAPGGPVCMIDDFVIMPGERWHSVGVGLLVAAKQEAKKAGAVLTVVVSAHRDEAKRAMLRDTGFGIASEWYVSPL